MSLALLALLSTPAPACGGLFCNSAAPTMQAAERIAFGIDEEAGTVEAHVQITYTGESQDFAWIVPVAGEPELFLSTDDLFQAVYFPTNPSYSLAVKDLGICVESQGTYSFTDKGASSDTDFAAPESGGVTVVSQQTVGPYETVTLEGDSSAALLDWLQANGYDLPDELSPKLDPYVSAGQSFVALRLRPDRTAGDIAPLGMKYPATKASIPIQLTAIAAAPDTRLEVYVFADHRVVPESYRHVIPNDMAYDWFTGTVSYDDIITIAADEAGGQAFATDFAGSTGPLAGAVWDPSWLELERLRTQPAQGWMESVVAASAKTAVTGGYYYGYGALLDANLSAVLREYLPLPASLSGVTNESYWWSCPSCFADEYAALDFDAGAATDALYTGWVQPLERAEALIDDHDQVSRLTSSLDAREMTVDPVFVENADMAQDVSISHVATLTYDCQQHDTAREDAFRQLAFPDGTTVDLPSEAWFAANGITEYQYLSELASIHAAVVEQTGASGDPEVVSDQRGVLADLVAQLNASFAERFGGNGGGCGCDGGAGAPVLPFGIGLATLLVRRKRR